MTGERILSIAVIGDTQSTSRLERTLLFREQNDPEREQLVQHLFNAEFDLLVHLGDMVVRGSSAHAWQKFDRLFAPAFARGIPVLPLMGNHEYWGDQRRRAAHLAERFPGFENNRWRMRRHGNLGLILLDTNISHYPRVEWENQTRWFANTIGSMEEDASIGTILVFSHHPPFTNSATIQEASFLQSDFFPAFFSSPKTVAFISGHVHGYERFAMHGKVFIVTGGGGGPRLRLHQGKKVRHADQFQGAALRPFNYLLIRCSANQIEIEIMGLEKNQSQIRLIDKVAICHNCP